MIELKSIYVIKSTVSIVEYMKNDQKTKRNYQKLIDKLNFNQKHIPVNDDTKTKQNLQGTNSRYNDSIHKLYPNISNDDIADKIKTYINYNLFIKLSKKIGMTKKQFDNLLTQQHKLKRK